MRVLERAVTLDFDEPVLLVGGAEADAAEYREAGAFAKRLIAVDGGADQAMGWGAVPETIIGDMDSIRADPPDGVQIVRIEEQDSTDLEKALRTVSAPLYIGVGFLHGRLDHTLAALHALVRYAEKRVILLGPEDVAFASPRDWRARFEPGDRVSFYPVRRVAAVGSKGLRWPLDGLVFHGGEQIGTSNEAVSETVAAWFAGPGAVTILPRRRLRAAVDSLA